jgi:3-ketosteroid 9alpha-monooxygenase subunit B
MHSHDYYEIPIAQVIAETESAVSLVLDVPDSLQGIFCYRPGQFLTVRLPIHGKYRHRCYSLCSAPGADAKHKITIKRVEGGVVSNQICSELRAGDKILVQPPAGHFVPASLEEDLLLFAGGSGVTPVLSILKEALARGSGKIVLVYANRDERSVIFREELADLSAAHPGRLTVLHWLETVQGLPSAAQLASLVGAWNRYEAFVCGPEPFMASVSQALVSLGVPDERIHVERFVSLPDEDPAEAIDAIEGGADARLDVLIDGEQHALVWPKNAKMLDTMLAVGLDAPYSCRVGGCSACMCRVIKGDVHMAQNLVLDARELAEGWVLACQSFPVSESIAVEIPG